MHPNKKLILIMFSKDSLVNIIISILTRKKWKNIINSFDYLLRESDHDSSNFNYDRLISIIFNQVFNHFQKFLIISPNKKSRKFCCF